MTNRPSFRGWIVIALAYIVAVLPIQSTQHLLWLIIPVIAAYFVLALRITRTTAHLAQTEPQLLLDLWRKAMRRTVGNLIPILGLMFLLSQAAQKFLADTPINISCSGLGRAYCIYNGLRPQQWEQFILAIGILSLFLILDHSLLVALTLLIQKYVLQSPQFVGRVAIGLRVLIACAALSATVISFHLLTPLYGSWSSTNQRIVETVYTVFEPLAADGVFIASNILGHPTICQSWPFTNGCALTDTRPFIARQLFIAALGAMLYGLLIVGILRLSRADAHKAKRGLVEDVYL
jgi:hypothetical protein